MIFRFYLTLTVAILILLYWADLHYTHVDSILDHSSSVLHQDEKSTRRRSHSLFLGACLCTLVIALVSIFLGLDEGLGYLITPILQTAQHLFRQVFPLAEDAEELLPLMIQSGSNLRGANGGKNYATVMNPSSGSPWNTSCSFYLLSS